MDLIPKILQVFGYKSELTSDRTSVRAYKGTARLDKFTSYTDLLPAFTWEAIREMRRDPKVDLGFGVATDPMRSAEFECSGDNAAHNEFVLETIHSVWARSFDQLIETFAYGWSGYETMYRQRGSELVFDFLFDFNPLDCKPVHISKKIVGMTVRGARIAGRHNNFHGKPCLWGMKKLFLANNPKFGELIGESLLRPAFAPWCEKHHRQGALHLRRLRFFKDAYTGDVIRYPQGRAFPQPDGSILYGEDIAREMVEERASGSVMAVPSNMYENTTTPLFDYSPPEHIPGGSEMLEYVSQLNQEIFDGIGVPNEIIEAAETGSGYSGRSIPFLVFLLQRQSLAEKLVKQIDKQMIRPLVSWNFGVKEPGYELTVKSLIDTIGEQMGEGGVGSALAGPAQPVGTPTILPMDTTTMSTLFDGATDDGDESVEAGARIARRLQRDLIAAGGKKKRQRRSTGTS